MNNNEEIEAYYIIVDYGREAHGHITEHKPLEMMTLLSKSSLFSRGEKYYYPFYKKINHWFDDNFNEQGYIIAPIHKLEKWERSFYMPVIFVYDEGVSMAIKMKYDSYYS